jgi:hypothetical protein
MDLEVEDPAIVKCTDFRDNEVWHFDNRTARDGVMHMSGEATYIVTDTNGNKREMRHPLPDYLKCDIHEELK